VTVFALHGTEAQDQLVRDALAACDFPFERLLPSLAREGKSGITVTWEDLSRRARQAGEHGHSHDEGVHPVEREVDGRRRVLGLFYLPPHTRVVLDSSLEGSPTLAAEVMLSEVAHAVDYHWLAPNGRRHLVWNALHDPHEHLTAEPAESGDVGHGHSWFDGAGGYSTWVGESMMAAFVRAIAPSIPVTISLSHPIGEQAVADVRAALDLDTPQPRQPVFASRTGVFHDSHKGITPVGWYDDRDAALAHGLRPCKVCKP
jgi:hypothetical protein